MPHIDIKTALFEYYKFMVAVDRQSDMGANEHEILYAVTEHEANSMMLKALKECPEGFTCHVSVGQIYWVGDTDRR